MVKKVKVTYQSNYNGCSVSFENDLPMNTVEADRVIVDVTDLAYDDCDEDGVYQGDIDEVKEFAVQSVKKHFGDDVDVIFEEDSSST